MVKYYMVVGKDVHITRCFDTIKNAKNYLVDAYDLVEIKINDSTYSKIRFTALYNDIPTGCFVGEEKHIDLQGWEESIAEQHAREYFEHHRDVFE